jgi:hypothetical protein
MYENNAEQQTRSLIEAMIANDRLSLRNISSRLAVQGIVNRNGQPFTASTIRRIIKSIEKQQKGVAA